jgi:5'-methylthioadenosine phosphorylase
MTNLACIGGSMAYKLMADGAIAGNHLGPQDTPFGPSAAIYLTGSGSESFYFLSRHGERGYHTAPTFINYRANIWALKELGVERIIAWSGPGAINLDMRPGSIVIINDLLDETRRRPTTFYEHGGLGFIRQWPVFCETVRAALLQAARKADLVVHDGGTYGCTEGPRLETPAEIRKLAGFGCDLVGMTLCPEAFLARELEICYAPICYVTNFAEGLVQRAYQPGLRFEGMTTAGEDVAIEKALERMPEVIAQTMRQLALHRTRDCPCCQSMSRYRRRGDIGNDWRKWILPGGGADS